MKSIQTTIVLLGAAGMVAAPAAAQDEAVPAPITGVWSLGETPSCDSGTAWVFFADGFYAEVQLPDGAPTAVGIWHDEGDAIAYTHAHMPFEGHEQPMRVRHLTIEERSPQHLVTRNYRGVARTFRRCPANSLKAPPGQRAH